MTKSKVLPTFLLRVGQNGKKTCSNRRLMKNYGKLNLPATKVPRFTYRKPVSQILILDLPLFRST